MLEKNASSLMFFELLMSSVQVNCELRGDRITSRGSRALESNMTRVRRVAGLFQFSAPTNAQVDNLTAFLRRLLTHTRQY